MNGRRRAFVAILLLVALLSGSPSAGAVSYAVVTDVSGNSNLTGTNVNQTTGKVGSYAGHFDATTSGAVRYGTGWASQRAQWSAAFWVKFDTVGTGHDLINSFNGTCASGTSCVMYVSTDSTNKINVGVYLSQGTCNGFGAAETTAHLTNANVWYHVAVTYTSVGGHELIYTNGTLSRDIIMSSSGGSTCGDSGTVNGMGYVGKDNVHNCACALDQVEFWNAALTAAQVADVYANNSEPDPTHSVSLYTFEATGAAANLTVTPSPVTDTSGGCLSLSWTAATGATGYSLFATQSGNTGLATASPMNSSSYSYITHVDGTAATKCGLASGAHYQWRVVGTSATGEGTPSGNARNHTPAARAASISTSGPSGTTLNVTWTLSGTFPSSDYYWNVFYKLAPATATGVPMNTTAYTWNAAVNATGHNITGLLVNTSYCAVVVPVGITGEGDVSASSCATTGVTPDAPVLSESQDTRRATLMWTVPTTAAAIQGYNVTDEGGNVSRVDASTTRLFALLPPEGTNHTYSVHAWTNSGNGLESNTVNVTGITLTEFGGGGTIYGTNGLTGLAAALGVTTLGAQLLWGTLFVLLVTAMAAFAGRSETAQARGAIGIIIGILLAVALGLYPWWIALLVLAVLGGAWAVFGRRAVSTGAE